MASNVFAILFKKFKANYKPPINNQNFLPTLKTNSSIDSTIQTFKVAFFVLRNSVIT